MERENIKFRLDSGCKLYKQGGGKLGRKTGYRKPKEQKTEQYAGVIKSDKVTQERLSGEKYNQNLCSGIFYGDAIEEVIL